MGYRGEPEWMNNGNAMLGFTKSREAWANNGFMRMGDDGTFRAWWQDDSFKLGYEGAIPAGDVHKHLLNWTTQECDVAVKLYVVGDEQVAQAHGQDEGGYFMWIADPDTKAIVRPDIENVFGYFGRDSYESHDYMQVLEQCDRIADGELGIASAFLMDHGAVFVANMELPEGITTEQGIEHRVRLQVCTSQNGRFATRWDLVDEFSVCSNSFRANLNKADKSGQSYSVKHTSRSMGRVLDARTALGLVYKSADEFSKFLDAMTQVDITNDQFAQIIQGLVPMPEAKRNDKGVQTNKGAQTIADNKRDVLGQMYRTDHRCNQFNGTLFGALQAWSTWNQWERPTGENLEASIMGAITGTFAKADAEFFDIVAGLDIDMGALAAAAQ